MKHNHASNTMLRLVGPFFDRRREEIRRARFENKELNVPVSGHFLLLLLLLHGD